MSISRQIREQIDACRPGSNDLALPELAELAIAVKQDRAVAAELERSQQFDRAASAALAEQPVPAGLMERLLKATAENQPTPAAPADAETPPSRWTRRRVLWAAGSLAAAALVAVTTWFSVPRPASLVSRDELSAAVTQWTNDGNVPASQWEAIKAPRLAVPGPVSVKKPTRWRHLAIAQPTWSGSGVAMDITQPGRQRAWLFVVSSNARVQVSSAPSQPTDLTLSGFRGKVKAVAWQDSASGLLYVLVVVEDGQRLDDFLRHQPIG
jgi:hypothetical protein